jgi:ubiquinone/menaquinone biosynthesis C-methylase UbiE
MHIADDFDEVIGIDVSDGMLQVARAHVHAANVDFHRCNGVEIPFATAAADAVFSTHVFQHLDSLELARATFAEVARVLRPGASTMIHLPMYRLPRGFSSVERALVVRHWRDTTRAKRRRRAGKPFMRGLIYSWEWLFQELPRLGFSDIEILVFATASNNDPHSYVLARRP